MNKHIILAFSIIALLAAACSATPTSTPVPTPDPAALFRQYLETENRGDIAGALAYFTDDAVITGLGSCAQAPCVGKDAIRKEIESGEAGHTVHTRIDVQSSGNTVSARIEHQNDGTRAAGIDRFVVLTTAEMRNGKVASITRKLDLNDTQTVAFLKFQQAHQPK